MNHLKVICSFWILLFITSSGSAQTIDESVQLIENLLDAFNTGKYEECIQYADTIISRDSGDYVTRTVKSRALYMLDREEEALEELDKALQSNPEYEDAYIYRAVLNSRKENLDTQKVFNDFATALILNPGSLKVYEQVGNFLMSINQYELAIKNYNKILEVDSTNYVVLVSRGRSYRKLSKYTEAFADLNRAIDLNPDHSLGFEVRAFAYLESKRFHEAVNDFTTLIALSKNEGPEFADTHAFTYNNRGFAYYNLGMLDQALEDINLSLQMVPANSYAFKNRALVRIAQKDFCWSLNTMCGIGREKIK